MNNTMNPTERTLIEELHHPDKNVRSQTALTIGKLSDAAMLTPLLDALMTETDMYVREDITWALVRIKETALQPLIKLLDDANPSTRHLATHVLGKIGGHEVYDPLIHALHDTEPQVISKAAFGLAQIGDDRAIPELVRLVGHENREVETMLMSVLERFGTIPVQPLMELMNNERWQVREQATDILGQIGDERALPLLIEALNDEEWQVRFSAVTALSYMPSATTKAALQQMLVDPDHRVQTLVSKVLKQVKFRKR
ncbi:MAG: HEAT repeat domain-containing protein [Anaerolineae bacterium]|nr:HEAT repeat domain-containing protein [Anaerolineae bacterium]